MIDWSFTKTAMDLFEWIQLSQFNSEMFMANIAGKYTYLKKFGSSISVLEKYICGCSCIGALLVLIIGPFILFSNLSFISN